MSFTVIKGQSLFYNNIRYVLYDQLGTLQDILKYIFENVGNYGNIYVIICKVDSSLYASLLPTFSKTLESFPLVIDVHTGRQIPTGLFFNDIFRFHQHM